MNDEQGNRSMARALLVSWTVVAILVIALSVGGVEVKGEVFILVGGIFPLLVAWAAGPRMVQYLSATASAATRAVTGGIAKLGNNWGGHTPGYTRPVSISIDNSDTGWSESDEQ